MTDLRKLSDHIESNGTTGRAPRIRSDLLADVTVMDVTPAMASEWLTHNTHNRNPKTRSIDRFSSDMSVGAWQWAGSSICFAADGTLLDGQNRLHAIVKSGCTVPFIIVRNLPMQAQVDIDTGVSRKLADVLTLNGETNATTLAAILRSCAAWDRGARVSLFHGSEGGSISSSLAFLAQHPETRDIAEWAKNNRAPLPPGMLGVAYYVFASIDQDDASEFFDRLEDGQHLQKGNPIYELRRTLTDRTSRTNTRMNRTFTFAITVKAWNAFREGVEVGLFRWSPGGAHPEAFPEPR
jgi:hypothetical protein